MDFHFKGKKYSLPVTLNQITVRQRIGFDQLFREEIKQLHDNIFQKDEDGNELEVDEMDISLMNVSIAVMNISYFTGIPIEEVENEMNIDDVMKLYFSCFHQLFEEQDHIELQTDYLFNDEFWKIEPPVLSNESKITFNELITSKQIIKQMQELSVGKWEAIPYLAAIYLKKEGEEFQESWLSPGNERLELMYDLPMDITMALGFFLQNSMNMYLETLVYSQEENQEMDQI
ncbi:hypothetical protein C1637_09895 [Chryseobacterium lactis]|uniref:Uncharacterized protein n=1 Tax=Chryseobacterium lactis TaxID=1241981 RepID=A0A3G6REP3_CHRLC|nr:hypothetical protein [Chryseobacterium lactis]AZA82177.1 hypothetical protein EG342_09805 [Chryseobacterium lactis]AZB02558.1 hypothetical protein EG341_00660 [Chryseobacterium lactis]PNW14147.1 hypothetical protein C1637_09895 [Chryseobacterium lactis]